MPNYKTVYTYEQITSNIQNIQSVQSKIEQKLDSLKVTEDSLKTNTAIADKRLDKRKSEVVSAKSKLTQELSNLNKMENAWQAIGYKNLEYRNKNEKLDSVFAKMSLSSFVSFVGLKKGDFVGRATEIFGNPKSQTSSSFSYFIDEHLVLQIHFSMQTGKINQIYLSGGNRTVQFIQRNKNASDSKCKLLGLPRYKIQQYLGKASIDYVYKKENYMEYDFFQNDTGLRLRLRFFFDKDNICESMSLHFLNMS